jgi:adenosylcobinamide amidohydrolase
VLTLEDATQADGRPVLVWRFSEPVRTVSTCVLGGGLGDRRWAINAEVRPEYHHDDPAAHAAGIGRQLGLSRGAGLGFLTAARVLDVRTAEDGGARCDATVGLTRPTWAAAAEQEMAWRPGTVNLVCFVPAPLDDAALVNALATATEAKAQALFESGIPGTGTASDAVAVCCPRGGGERYGGPRSRWGGPLARAVHRAVTAGIGA